MVQGDGWSGVVGADGPEVAFLPAAERIDEVGEPVEVGDDLAARSSQPSRVAATARRSARRTTARATSRAAATRFSPGSTNSVGGSKRVGHVVDDRLERVDHRLGRERDAGLQLARGSRARWRARRPTTKSSRWRRTSSSSSSEPRSVSARARPSSDTASSTAPYAVGSGAVLADPAAVEQSGGAVVALARVDLRSHLRRSLRPGVLQPCGQWRVRSGRGSVALHDVRGSRSVPRHPADGPGGAPFLDAEGRHPHRAPEAVDEERAGVRGAGGGGRARPARRPPADAGRVRRLLPRRQRHLLPERRQRRRGGPPASHEAVPTDRGRRPRHPHRAGDRGRADPAVARRHRTDQRLQAHGRRRRLRARDALVHALVEVRAGDRSRRGRRRLRVPRHRRRCRHQRAAVGLVPHRRRRRLALHRHREAARGAGRARVRLARAPAHARRVLDRVPRLRARGRIRA